jgi:hypothetical protein
MSVTSVLAQDKYTLRGNGPLTKDAVPTAVGPMINDKMAGVGRRNLNTSNEAEPFLDYAYFLGFTEPYLDGWVMDPTRAIEGVLDNLQRPRPRQFNSSLIGWRSNYRCWTEKIP